MVRRLLTPRWLATHLLAVLAVAACVGLGQWQLGRAAAFQQSAAGSSEQAPVPLQTLTRAQGNLDGAVIGRLVTVAGTFDAAHSYLVPGKVVDGKTGLWLLSVLRVAGGDGVLVVRGWVAAAAAAAGYPTATGPVLVTGRLAGAEDPSGGLPPGTLLPLGQVPAASPVALLSLVPYRLYDGYVALRSERPAVASGPTLVPSPRESNSVPGFYFQHLAYVGLWWLFAGFVLFFWWRLVRDHLAPGREPGD